MKRHFEELSETVSVAAQKREAIFRLENFKGKILAIYVKADNRNIRFDQKIDGKITEIPSLSTLDTLNLSQETGYVQPAKVREYHSSSPYGFAHEFEIEFEKEFEIIAINLHTASIDVSSYLIIWEEYEEDEIH